MTDGHAPWSTVLTDTEEVLVWMVTDADYDSTWVVAVYSTRALAEEHAARDPHYQVEAQPLWSMLKPWEPRWI